MRDQWRHQKDILFDYVIGLDQEEYGREDEGETSGRSWFGVNNEGVI